jgi:hypothetical protein
MNSGQIEVDMASFQQAPPEERKAAAEKKAPPKPREQVRVERKAPAKEKAPEPTEEERINKKHKLIQQLTEYVKFMEEYHPERLEYISLPKKDYLKCLDEELAVAIKNIEAELGKRSGLEFVKMIWVNGLAMFEQATWLHQQPLQGLGAAAEMMVSPMRDTQGKPVAPGPAVPTLAEFAVKYSSWFSSSVEVRMLLMTTQLVAGVRKANMHKESQNVQKQAATSVSRETEDLMKEI